MITQETPTTGIPEYLTAIGTKIANVVMLLNSPAPNEIKDKYRADLAKIKFDLWTKIEGEISRVPMDTYSNYITSATQIDKEIDQALKGPDKAKAQNQPTPGPDMPLITLEHLNGLTATKDDGILEILAPFVDEARMDDAVTVMDTFLTQAASQAFKDQKTAPPVLNLLGEDEDTCAFAHGLTGFEPTTPSRFKAKNFHGVAAVLRGVERAGTKLPPFKDHKGRRFAWIVCSNGALPDQDGVEVLSIVLNKGVNRDKVLALRDPAWALAAASEVTGTDHDVIGRLI